MHWTALRSVVIPAGYRVRRSSRAILKSLQMRGLAAGVAQERGRVQRRHHPDAIFFGKHAVFPRDFEVGRMSFMAAIRPRQTMIFGRMR